jgi:hypothetical protein
MGKKDDKAAEAEVEKEAKPAKVDYRSEQEKTDKRDPVGKHVDPVKAEVLDIAAKQPYPTGSPPDPMVAIGRAPPPEEEKA